MMSILLDKLWIWKIKFFFKREFILIEMENGIKEKIGILRL